MHRNLLLPFLALLVLGCGKSIAHESPTTVPVGVVGVAPITSSGESDPGPARDRGPLGSCGLRATLRERTPHSPGIGRAFAIDLKNEGTRAVKLILPGDGS